MNTARDSSTDRNISAEKDVLRSGDRIYDEA
jgi:hypothetical protein